MRRVLLLCGAALLCARASAEETENEPPTHERREALKAILGDAPAAARVEWMRIAAGERGVQRRTAVTFSSGALEWVNLGPSDATYEVNGVAIGAVDSGRPTGIAIDPRDPEVVYLSGAGSGIWKTWNFLSGFPSPTWVPITDGATDLSVGALAMDPGSPDTLYAGLGDFDSNFHAAGVIKSMDGGGSWSAPVMLSGGYPAGSGGLASQPLNIRDLRVDPIDGTRLLAATESGLYRSVNSGASFTLIDLPNSGAQRSEALWSLAWVGASGSNSIWLATGVYACSPAAAPPWTGNNATCNLGDIWRSTDSGATWTSLRATGVLPVVPDFGRVTVATGSTANPSQTVVYAFVASGDDTVSRTIGFWRSNDGGANWTIVTGTLANATLPANGVVDCNDLNAGHEQSDYNQYLVVDPQNPDHVVAGGNKCGLRTLNGTAANPVWENVAHWLPLAGGSVAAGLLPFVHADWHVAAATVVDGVTRVFAGTDGGLFSSANVFDPATLPTFVTWRDHNRGLSSHLCYSVASGDPASGNPLTVFTGLQDNGTRFRDETLGTTFNQRLGGDGIGAAVSKGTAGEFWWASVQHKHYFCQRSSADCLDLSSFNWSQVDPDTSQIAGDSQPFLIDYAPIATDPTGQSVLTNTSRGVWKSEPAQQWTKLFAAPGTQPITKVVASATIPSLYGAVNGFDRVFMVTGNETTWTVSNPISIGGVKLWTPATSLDFPPVTPPGKQPGDVYVASSAAAVMETGALVPASAGHLFLTQDRGVTFTPLHGNGTSDLPNVPVYVVRYDPADTTNNTLYAGTLVGVYRTTDGGATWARFGTGLPHVAVTAMFIARNDSLLRVATWGRGIWEIYPDSQGAPGVRGDGDYDRNLAIDFTDVAALAARMGTTPATPGWPTYSHYADLIGSANAIDDADLAALLGKLGDHP